MTMAYRCSRFKPRSDRLGQKQIDVCGPFVTAWQSSTSPDSNGSLLNVCFAKNISISHWVELLQRPEEDTHLTLLSNPLKRRTSYAFLQGEKKYLLLCRHREMHRFFDLVIVAKTCLVKTSLARLTHC